jgi:tight adherence protein B
MSLKIPLLLLLACFCLVGLLFSYSMLQRAEARRRHFEQRLTGTLKRHQGGIAIEETYAQPMRVSVPVVKLSLSDRLAAMIGADPSRPDLYPIKWWLVPVIALIPARLLALLIEFLFGSLGMLLIPVLCWAISWHSFKFFHNRRALILFKQFPDALAMIVRSVRVGIPVNEAIRSVAAQVAEPTASVFARLSDDVAIGTPLDQALRAMAEHHKVAEYRFFATALSLQSQTGGGISETLENLADVIRKRVAARARGKALAAEARASATALAILPGLAMLALWLMNPAYIEVLFVNPLGNEILAGGALLLGGGVLSMKWIIQKSLK